MTVMLALAGESCSPTADVLTGVPQQTTPQPLHTPTVNPSILPPIPYEDQPPTGALKEFITDFSVHSIPYNKVVHGGPGKDGIPAIDFPKFISVEDADSWIKPQEPVAVVRVDGDVRAYPIQILVWHEVVNDVVGGKSLVITYCPLCNSGIAFDRNIGGTVLDFGTTGRLYRSNLLMYDRLTESWWQQASGEAVIGEYTGTQLSFYPLEMVAWDDFNNHFPQGKVLSRDTGESRRYGLTPYHLFDDLNRNPFLYNGPETPANMPPMTRVLAVEVEEETVAYPYPLLADKHVINDLVGGAEILIIWRPGAVSALDKFRISNSREVGSAVAYSRTVGGSVLQFRIINGRLFDAQTGSEWNIFGEAFAGPLSGVRLDQIVATNHFWFSWYAFNTTTNVYEP